MSYSFLRKKLEIKVIGKDPKNPILSFDDLNFDERIYKEIDKQKYIIPTPIQAQVIISYNFFKALPIALSGRDLIGIAKTGSGKTLSFVWPMLIHVLDQVEDIFYVF